MFELERVGDPLTPYVGQEKPKGIDSDFQHMTGTML